MSHRIPPKLLFKENYFLKIFGTGRGKPKHPRTADAPLGAKWRPGAGLFWA